MFGATFWTILTLTTVVLFIFVALVVTVLISPDQPPIPLVIIFPCIYLFIYFCNVVS